MPDYRRVIVSGGTFFFTVITFDRQPILTSDLSRQTLRRAWKTVQGKHLSNAMRSACWQNTFVVCGHCQGMMQIIPFAGQRLDHESG